VGVYAPTPIIAGEVSQTNEMAKDPLSIQFPRDNEFAQQFLGGVPEQITTVTVFRGHQTDGDGEFRTYWKGRVASASAEGDTVSLSCENIFTSMRRPGLRARYQKVCRHALYSAGCGALEADFAESVTATAVAGTIVTVTGIAPASAADGFFTAGTLKTASGELRYITKHEGSTLTLMYPLASLSEEVNESSAGEASVTIYPGCDHTRSTCVDKFDNVENFGGFPWLPSKNPFGNSVIGSIS
jgi:uncharacterized phage protein (TIGR02218 family)